MRLEFSDPSKTLQTPALTAKTGDILTPLVLGNVFNISPIVEDSATAKYRASYLPCAISAVRDNGIPVAYADHNNGSFTLAANPVGQVTCDAVANTYDTMPTACGYLSSLKNISINSLINFGTLQASAKIGLYVTNSETVWDLINQLCESIGAIPSFNELGQLDLVHIPHAGNAEITLTDDDIELDGFAQNSVIKPANLQLNYAQNWTIQSNLIDDAAVLSPALRERYSREYLQIDINNNAPNAEKQIINTLLVNQSDAQAEATRRGILWANQRETWRFNALMNGLPVRLGQRIASVIEDALIKTGTVISWTKQPDQKSVEIEVLF